MSFYLVVFRSVEAEEEAEVEDGEEEDDEAAREAAQRVGAVAARQKSLWTRSVNFEGARVVDVDFIAARIR